MKKNKLMTVVKAKLMQPAKKKPKKKPATRKKEPTVADYIKGEA